MLFQQFEVHYTINGIFSLRYELPISFFSFLKIIGIGAGCEITFYISCLILISQTISKKMQILFINLCSYACDQIQAKDLYRYCFFFFFITSNLELKLVPQVFWILSLSNSYFLKKKPPKLRNWKYCRRPVTQ